MVLTICYIFAVVVITLVGCIIAIILSFLSRLLGWHTIEGCYRKAAAKLDCCFYWLMEKLSGRPGGLT